MYLYIQPELLIVGRAVLDGREVPAVGVVPGTGDGDMVGTFSWLPKLANRLLKFGKLIEPQPGDCGIK